MQAKPRLSLTTMMSFCPSITDVAISEFIIEIGAIAGNHDHFQIRQRYLDADPAGDPRSPCTNSRIRRDSRDGAPWPPQLVHRSSGEVRRRPRDHDVELLARAHESAEHFGVGGAGALRSAQCSERRSLPIQPSALAATPSLQARGAFEASSLRIKRGEAPSGRRLTIRQCLPMLDRVERLHVDADAIARSGILEQRPGAGGEVRECACQRREPHPLARRGRWPRRSR